MARALAYSERCWLSSSSEIRAAPVTSFEDLQRVFAALHGAARDVDLGIDRAQRDVAGGDCGDERENCEASAFLAREQVCARGFGEASQAPEDVQLPRREDVRLEPLGRARRWRDQVPARDEVGADLWEQSGARGAECTVELLDSRGRDAHVEIVGERADDQFVEDRILELFPPLRVGDVAGLEILETKLLRQVERGPRVVVADDTAAKHAGDEQAGSDSALPRASRHC